MRGLSRVGSLSSFTRRVLVLIIGIVLWETSARLGLLNVQVLSSPSEIVSSFVLLLSTGALLVDVADSVRRVLVGFALGSLAGVTAATFMGLSRACREYLEFLIEFLRPIPPIAWIPISILWFGIGDAPAYFLVGLGTFFPVFTNTIGAIKKLELRYVRLALSLGATKPMTFRRVVVPMVLPDLMTGLRVGLGVGWIVVITAEMVGAQSGLGYMIQLNRVLLQMPNVIAGMIAIGVVGLLLSFAMGRLEDLVIPWRRRMAITEREGR